MSCPKAFNGLERVLISLQPVGVRFQVYQHESCVLLLPRPADFHVLRDVVLFFSSRSPVAEGLSGCPGVRWTSHSKFPGVSLSRNLERATGHRVCSKALWRLFMACMFVDEAEESNAVRPGRPYDGFVDLEPGTQRWFTTDEPSQAFPHEFQLPASVI